MDRLEFLTVLDRFQLSGIGLTLLPDFDVPNQWRDHKELVTIVTPEGEEFEALAQFNLTHFNIPDPAASTNRRWRVLVTLPELEKERVPLGSKLLVSSEIHNALSSGCAA